jgi:hypothetical protein
LSAERILPALPCESAALLRSLMTNPLYYHQLHQRMSIVAEIR